MLVSSDFEIVPVQVPKKKTWASKSYNNNKKLCPSSWINVTLHWNTFPNPGKDMGWWNTSLPASTSHPRFLFSTTADAKQSMLEQAECAHNPWKWNYSHVHAYICIKKYIYILYKYISSYITVFFDSNLIYLYIDLICILHIAFTK